MGGGGVSAAAEQLGIVSDTLAIDDESRNVWLQFEGLLYFGGQMNLRAKSDFLQSLLQQLAVAE